MTSDEAYRLVMGAIFVTDFPKISSKFQVVSAPTSAHEVANLNPARGGTKSTWSKFYPFRIDPFAEGKTNLKKLPCTNEPINVF